MNRRQFLGTGASLVAGAGTLLADPFGWPVGIQTYPTRDTIGKDFAGTLRMLSAAGYQSIEMCSPPGYTSSGFGALVKMTAPEMKRAIKAAGLLCESCHYQFGELKQNLDERIAFAKELGLKYMVLSMFGGIPDSAPLADWGRAAGELNKVGERVKKAGLQPVYHNHNFEFRQIGGVLIYDHLLSVFDKDLIKLQFQVAVISDGYNAADYFEKYSGRFVSMHLADWSTSEKKQVPIGAGVVDWKRVFTSARSAGVKNYFVEMSLDLMKASTAYLHGLKA
jgi:sugar phosphate isomerase/epimerase